MKSSKKIFMWSGIVIELAGIILLAKAMTTDSSPAVGVILLVIGVFVLVIGMATKSKESQMGAS